MSMLLMVVVLSACDEPGGGASSQPPALLVATNECEESFEEVCKDLAFCAGDPAWALASELDPNVKLSGSAAACLDTILRGQFRVTPDGGFTKSTLTCAGRETQRLFECEEAIDALACRNLEGFSWTYWGREDALIDTLTANCVD